MPCRAVPCRAVTDVTFFCFFLQNNNIFPPLTPHPPHTPRPDVFPFRLKSPRR